MFEGLTTGDILALTTYLVRDISAIWTLATAGVSLLSVSSGQPAARTITGGALVWLVALGGYLAPVGKSRFFDRDSILVMLAVALGLWAMVFTRLILTATKHHLQHHLQHHL
jgi:hypothetical protein